MNFTVSGEIIRYHNPRIKGWNLYVPGTRFGAHHFKRFNKIYTYVALPESQNWVFLRTAAFIQVDVPKSVEPNFVIVHDVGAQINYGWDPPKGQVEYKEYESIRTKYRTPHTRLHALLKEGVTREIEEESKIRVSDIEDFRENSNLVVAGKHDDLPRKFHYQYHLFEGRLPYNVYLKAKAKLDKMRNNPVSVLDLPKDVIEKDAIALWRPSDGLEMIAEGDPRKIVQLYLAYRGFNQ